MPSLYELAAPAHAGAPRAPPVPWAEEAHETSGMTSRLILAYLEHRGGRAAVDRVLELCGLEDAEPDLRDEGHWFSFATKVRLLIAASEVLDDPQVARHLGERAIPCAPATAASRACTTCRGSREARPCASRSDRWPAAPRCSPPPACSIPRCCPRPERPQRCSSGLPAAACSTSAAAPGASSRPRCATRPSSRRGSTRRFRTSCPSCGWRTCWRRSRPTLSPRSRASSSRC